MYYREAENADPESIENWQTLLEEFRFTTAQFRSQERLARMKERGRARPKKGMGKRATKKK